MKNIFKIKSYLLAAIFLSLMLWFSDTAAASALNRIVFAEGVPAYRVNNDVYLMDAAPFLENGRILVPSQYLVQSLGVEQKNVAFNEQEKSLELRLAGEKIQFKAGDNTVYVNTKSSSMDVAPALKDGVLYLPAKWVANKLGYTAGWDERRRALLLGPPGDLPETRILSLKASPKKVRPCEIPAADLRLNRKVAASSITFIGEYLNVYNAGVAARYLNDFVLEPNHIFSFNEAVGERTLDRGFIEGYDILEELTIGGGVCRTSTVLYQAATEAGLEIKERHPHFHLVHYTAPGTDASVSWGWMDLKFKNTLCNPLLIKAGLEEEEQGRRLWAEFWEVGAMRTAEVSILRSTSGSVTAKNVERTNLVALVKDGVSFASLEQVSDLLQLRYEMEEKDGRLCATVYFNNQPVNVSEGSRTAYTGDVEFELGEAPFCISGSNCRLWLPLKDLAALAGAEARWSVNSQPSIILDLSGAF